MPTPVRYFIIVLVGLGIGTLTWGVGGLLGWNTPLLRGGDTVYMDAQGAIGIGIGSLAGAATAILLFRGTVPQPVGKPLREPDDLR
jgi:hypothetical protein